MLFSVDPHSGVPVYRQIMDQVKLLIASGLLEPGDELPSTRSLSSELGVNPMTISKAYGLLERGGVVERRPGRALVVRAFGDGQLRDRKTEQLRASLEPSTRLVEQLGIGWDEALRLFGELLAQRSKRGPDDEESGS